MTFHKTVMYQATKNIKVLKNIESCNQVHWLFTYKLSALKIVG
jgi:hypothetical protein